MAYVRIDHSDGQYSIRDVEPDEAQSMRERGYSVHFMPDHVLAEYREYIRQGDKWHLLLQTMDNLHYAEQRVHELEGMTG